MRLEIIDSQLCVGCQSCMFACSRRSGDVSLSKSTISVKSRGGMANGFLVIICRACIDPLCAKSCPYNALIPLKGGGVKLIPEKCIGCKACMNSCLINAVFWDKEQNKPRICIHCGYCVNYCPHGVLSFSKGGRRPQPIK